MMRLLLAGLIGVVMLAGETAWAHDYEIGDLTIVHPVARPTMGAAANSAVYLTIHNDGEDDVLIDVEGPAANAVELHTTIEEDGILKMRHLGDGLEIPADSEVELAAGGHHVMLMGLADPLEYGDEFTITLIFEKAGRIDIDVMVVDLKDLGDGMDHD